MTDPDWKQDQAETTRIKPAAPSSPMSATEARAKADMCERLSFPPEDSRHIAVDGLLREYAAILRAQAAPEAPGDVVDLAKRLRFPAYEEYSDGSGWVISAKQAREDMTSAADALERLSAETARWRDSHALNLGWEIRARAAEDRLAEAMKVITEILATEYAQEQLRTLKLGIGTKTRNAVWLRLHAVVGQQQDSGAD